MAFRLVDEQPAAQDDVTRYGEALLQAEAEGRVGTAAQLGITPTDFNFGAEPSIPEPSAPAEGGRFRLLSEPQMPVPEMPRFRFDDQLPDEGPSLMDSAKKSYYNFRKQFGLTSAIRQGEQLNSLLTGEWPLAPQDKRNNYERLLAGQAQSIQDWVEYGKKASLIPNDPQIEKLAKTDNWKDFFNVLGEAPLHTVMQVTAENAFQFIPQMALTIAGGFAGGPLGLAVAAGVTSREIDYMAEFTQALEGVGVDVTNPQAIYKALNNPEVLQEAKSQANLHSSVVGLFDGLTAGLAGKVLAPAKLAEKPIARELTNLAGQTAADIGGAGLGEAGGQLAQGKKIQIGEVGLEMVGESLGGVSNVASAVLSGAREPSALGGDTDSRTGRPTVEPAPEPGSELRGESTPIQPFTEADTLETKLRLLEQQLKDTAAKYGVQKKPKDLFGNDTGLGGFKVPLTPGRRRNTIRSANISDQRVVDLLDALPETSSGTNLTLDEFQTGPQVRTFGFRKYAAGEPVDPMEQLNLTNRMLQNIGLKQRRALAKKYGLSESDWNSDIFRRNLLKDVYQAIPQAERQVAQIAQKAIAGWAKEFFPAGTKVIIGDGDIVNTLNGKPGTGMKSAGGWAARLRNDLITIEFNMESVLPAMLTEQMGLRTANETRNGLLGVAAHEFGHALVGEVFHSMSPEIQQAVIGEYETMLNQLGRPDLPAKPLIEKWFRPGIAKGLTEEINLMEEEWGYPPGVSDLMRKWSDGADYMLSFDEWAAEQIARVFQGREDIRSMAGPFWKRVANQLKLFYEKVVKRFAPNETVQDFVDYSLTRKRLEELQAEREEFRKKYPQNINVSNRIADTVQKVMRGEIPPPKREGPRAEVIDPKELRGDLDTFNKGVGMMLTLTQLYKLNQHIPGVQRYLNTVRQWWNTKLIWTAKADARLRQWRQLTHAQSKDMANFLNEVTLESDRLDRGLTPQELDRFARKWHLTEDMFTLYDDISQDMNSVIDALERVSEKDLARLHRNNPEEFQKSLVTLRQEMDKLRNRDYFPLARFGEFTATVKARRPFQYQGKSYKIGEIVAFEQREFKSERNALVRQLKKTYPAGAVDVLVGKLSKKDFAFTGMPPQLIERVKEILGDKPQQMQDFEELLYKLSPAQSFKKHLLSRKGTPGFDKNAMRAYADYMARFSNHIARIEYHGALQDAINEVYDSATTLHQAGVDATKRTQIGDHLKDHFDYIMNPQNEWANLRAFGFMWYLGFLPKSAFVNLTQVPLVTYPWLAYRHGDTKTVAEITRAYKLAFQSIRNGTALDPALQEAISKGIADGFLDESLATELAAVAEGSVLQRYTGGTPLGWDVAQRGITAFQSASAYLFQQAEKVNRRVAFVAAFNLAKGEGMSNIEAYAHARDAVESTQYEYARWNRAKFMQGKRSIIFLFWQYLQNTMFFAFGGDKGAMRFWAMMLLAGGLQGLPGSDDVMKMLTFLFRQMGWTEKDVQQDLRGLIKELGVNPDLAMHGLSRYAFGLPQVFSGTNFTWAPQWMQDDKEAFRGFDLSGSVSMGSVVPAVPDAMVAYTQGKDAKDMWYDVQADVGGAFGALPMNLMLALTDDHPDWYKRWERMMPTAVKSIGRAFKYASEGKAETRTGGTIEEFDVNDPSDLALVVGQSLGFRPGDLAREQEKSWAARSTAAYWETRRRAIMQEYYWAWKHNDNDAIKAVYDAWAKYNKQAPYRELKISRDDLVRSLESRRKGVIREERDIPRSNRNRGIQEEVYQLYP